MKKLNLLIEKLCTPSVIIFTALSFLLFIAILFCNQRLYGDVASYLFFMIYKNGFDIEHNRFVIVLTEWLPVLMIKKQMSLRHVILGFSISEWLYFSSCIAAAYFLFKDKVVALAILFAYLLGNRWNYFNPVSELYVAMPLAMLVAAIFRQAKFSTVLLLIAIVLNAFILFAHPLYFIVLPAILVVVYFQQQHFRFNTNHYLYTASIVAIMIVRYLYLDEYEKNPLSTLKNPDYDAKMLLSFKFIKDYFLTNASYYLGCIILSLLCAYNFIKTKKALYAFGLIAFIFGYWLMVMFKFGFLYPATYEPFERYLFPIPIIVSIVYFSFCYKQTKLENAMLLAVFMWQFALLFQYGKFVQKAFSIMEKANSYANQFPEQKILFEPENYYPQLPYSSSDQGHNSYVFHQSVLLSASQPNSRMNQVLLRYAVQDSILNKIQENDYLHFYANWVAGIQHLNTAYFNMRPSKIRIANTSGVQGDMPDEFYKNIQLDLFGATKFKPNSYYLLPVRITNLNDTIPILSGRRYELVNLSYRWLQNDQMVIADGLRTPILGDVYTYVDQYILIQTPPAAGQYQIKVDIVYEGKRWVNATNLKSITIK